MFTRYTGKHVMDDYQRPAAQNAARQAVDGLIPVKTKIATPKTQPFRDAQLVAAKTAPAGSPLKSSYKPIDMTLGEASCQSRHHVQPRIVRKLNRLRTWLLRGAVAVMLLVIGIGGLLTSQGYLKLHKVFKGTAATAVALQTNVNPDLLKGEGDGRINILLAGIGGQGHDGADLTDTLMVASIDPVNKTATLLSVPRDLWVTLPGSGSMKLNAAFETGVFGYLHQINTDNTNSQAVQAGFASIDQTLEGVLGISINYNMLLDFQAFQQAVDTVGGVTVNVPADLYDPTMAWQNNGNPYLARAGVQSFDGAQALNYVRSRETSSDFARAQRQRAVLLALKQKAVTLGVLADPAKLSGLLDAFGNNVQTDLSLSDANRLYGIMKQIGNNQVNSISLAGSTTTTSSAAGTDSLVTTEMLGSQSIVLPKAGLGDYSAIQNYVHTQLPDGYLLKEHAAVELVGSNAAALQAEVLTLKSYGYNVVGTTLSASPIASTSVTALYPSRDSYTKHYLEQRYSVTAGSQLPAGITKPTNADFVVVLGS